MKKFLFSVVIILSFFFSFKAFASESVNLYLFWGDGCPHCEKEIAFLGEFKKENPNINLIGFEIYRNMDNAMLFQQFAKELNANISGVPALFIGDEYFVGYSSEITPVRVRDRVNYCLSNDCPDPFLKFFNIQEETIPEKEVTEIPSDFENEEVVRSSEEEIPVTTEIEVLPEEQNSLFKIPVWGEINAKDVSLPVLTVFMGILDGFNPCAMWTLLFLISLLLGMENRKRMWILGSAFIIASASVYFIFMSAWLNLILFIGFVIWVRLLIGLLALAGGGYSLNKFLHTKSGTCSVTGGEKRRKVFDNLKKIVQQKSFWLALGGIIVLAFLVNLVELVCSAGLPAIYTQILALNNLANWQYYFYIFLYVFFFMVDDLLIFIVAMVTLKMTGLSTRYARYSHLIGGILMIIIGILLIFKPEWLMFG
ncbi:MAG: hypothetical protein PHT84_03990 [Candidatus Pacebacteria bacterium]|nr:hypothetical protein [Candidatus Paceibacterota bacterium]